MVKFGRPQWADVPCSVCGAASGENCKTRHGSPAYTMHTPRLTDAIAAAARSDETLQAAQSEGPQSGGESRIAPFTSS